MLLGATAEYINTTDNPMDGLENTKELDLGDTNSNFFNGQCHNLQGLIQRNQSLGSVDYSDDDLEVDRDEEVRN